MQIAETSLSYEAWFGKDTEETRPRFDRAIETLLEIVGAKPLAHGLQKREDRQALWNVLPSTMQAWVDPFRSSPRKARVSAGPLPARTH